MMSENEAHALIMTAMDPSSSQVGRCGRVRTASWSANQLPNPLVPQRTPKKARQGNVRSHPWTGMEAPQAASMPLA